MLPVSETLRPWVTDVTFWTVGTFTDNAMQAHLVITVLVWRSVPAYLRRRMRRALDKAMTRQVMQDAVKSGFLRDEFWNWPVVVKIRILTDRRTQ